MTFFCPLCGREPVYLSGKLRDERVPWATAFCRYCWRPGVQEHGNGLAGEGSTRADALADWNRQCALFWGGLVYACHVSNRASVPI